MWQAESFELVCANANINHSKIAEMPYRTCSILAAKAGPIGSCALWLKTAKAK